MPKFTVLLQQYVEETAEMEVEAKTVAEAVVKGYELLKYGDVDDWSDGIDVTDKDVYAVKNAKGEIVWER